MKKILLITTIAAAALVGCSDNAEEKSNLIELDTISHVLSYGDEVQINATSQTPITYTVENEYHAKVSETGLVTAGRIGATIVNLTNGEDTKKVAIGVVPKSNLYLEPDITFGMTRAAVKAELGTPDSETDTAVAYSDWSTRAPILMCTFDDADKLEDFVVMVKTAYSSELATFLAERYMPAAIDRENYTVLCVNGLTMDKSTMLIGAVVYNVSYWMVLYMPYTQSGTRTTTRTDIMQSIDELMQKMQ